ncbi:HesB/IscA family protein [Alienimonas californiensis]|uniref:Iron-sulfur cluster insertion protein ErpA n=1 Tax=Alienimonas californiensis TaxID=2527989 RepID=A0A517P7Z1_9PLAN|nr:iron-sulfur cluster assembly accessory protein [Alienimonas californiensis]QDT15500.1 Iron-sulfur cluster insertion protein ErpA [Alienimonas californiensis]
MPATAEAPPVTGEAAVPQTTPAGVPDVADLPTEGCVTVTEAAVAEVRRVIAEQALPEGSVLRVGVSGGGCSGFSYALGFDDSVDESKDEVFAQHGQVVAVPYKCGPHLDGTVIDFYAGVEKRGFTFENPNARNTCGCGSSFSA